MRTHCLYGHALEGQNLKLVRADGYLKRRCAICLARRKREYIIRKIRRAA